MIFPRRLISKVTPEPNSGCWLWTASDNGRGYGRVKMNGSMQQAHRVFYELANGPIPDGHDIDHLCRVTWCVNPSHLEPVTHRTNVQRGATGATTTKRQRGKTHCPRGHEYAGRNLIVRKNGARQCRECVISRNRVAKYGPPQTKKSHCKNDHPLDGPDTVLAGPNKTYRICLICRRARDRKRRPGKTPRLYRRKSNDEDCYRTQEKRYVRVEG